jgi:peptidylprolyl isomerase
VSYNKYYCRMSLTDRGILVNTIERCLMRKLVFFGLGLVLVLSGALVFSGCSSGSPKTAPNSSSTTPASNTSGAAKTGDNVRVDYTLTIEDGTVYDTSVGRSPLEFTLGNNQVIKGFENAVVGMKPGDKKTVTLPPSEAYGERDESLVSEIPRSALSANVTPEVGQMLQGQNESGQLVTVKIIEVNDTTVKIDANSPLAGETLTFEITLVEIVKGT